MPARRSRWAHELGARALAAPETCRTADVHEAPAADHGNSSIQEPDSERRTVASIQFSAPTANKVGRITALDVIRGVALCGIIFVNIGPLTHFGYEDAIHDPANFGDPSGWLQLLVQQRFFPIFALLFGIGFSIFLDSAARTSPRPRLLLLRRLLLLLAIGIPFQFLQGGSALLPFAMVGLVILLPSTWLPRWLSAAAAVVFIVGSLVLAGGGVTLIPGMFLLGSTLSRYGVVPAIGRARRGSLIALVSFSVLAGPLVAWQTITIEVRIGGLGDRRGVLLVHVLSDDHRRVESSRSGFRAAGQNGVDQLRLRRSADDRCRCGSGLPPQCQLGGFARHSFRYSHPAMGSQHTLASPLHPRPPGMVVAMGHMGTPTPAP
jgi:hypothetical protein